MMSLLTLSFPRLSAWDLFSRIDICLLKFSALHSGIAANVRRLRLETLERYEELLPDLVQILLQSGVDPKAIVIFGRSLLHSSLMSTLFHRLRSHPEGHVIRIRFVGVLLEAGADVTRLCNEGGTAAQYAWNLGHWDVWCEAVLANRLDIQEIDQSKPEGWECVYYGSSADET